jgi:hypothetical protein
MNYIGYINKAQYFEHTTEIINLMKGYGCVNIHIEETKDKKRIEWCKFIDSLQSAEKTAISYIIYSRLVISYYPYYRYYSYYLYFPVVHHALVEGNTTFEHAKMP